MPDNIDTDTAVVEPDVNNPTTDRVLIKYAAEIRRLGKRVKEDIVTIGRYLDQAQKHAGRGAWLAWIKAEFGWSDQTAYHFIHLYRAQEDPEFQKFWNSNLPLSSLYLLAAPNTPEAARQEVAERIEAGARVTVAEVTETIAQAKAAAANSDEGQIVAVEDDEDQSIQQRRAQHAELFTEPEPGRASDDGNGLDHGADLADRLVKPDSDPETLVAHYQRDEEGRHALFDVLRAELPANPFAKLCEMDAGTIASRIFETVGATKSRVISEKLKALVTPKSKTPGKPFRKTLNLAANSTREERGNRFRH